jgi:hypothetical protein
VTYTEHTDGFEFTRSSTLHLAIILLVEMLLFIGGIYCITVINEPFNYFVALPLLLLFVLIAMGIAPAINAHKNGHKILIWGANKNGLLIPAQKSSFTKYIPPLLVSWKSINKAIFTKKLIDRSVSSETSTSIYVLVVELENRKRILLSYPEEFEQGLFNFFGLAGHCENRTHTAQELLVN